MKELSIEEKAKAYDEALSVAQETYTTQPMYREWLAKMFPELREKSEDERIMGAFRDFAENYLFWGKSGLTKEKALAWLEKQGRQKPTWSKEDSDMVDDIVKSLKKYQLQMPNYRVELQMRWLKFLKERVLPQNFTVTDEELIKARNEAYNDALDKLEYHSDTPTFNDGWSAAIWYLKKRNTMPQSHWKPSDEQMKCISDVVADAKYKNDISTNGYEPYTHLSTLLQQLKKLMEE